MTLTNDAAAASANAPRSRRSRDEIEDRLRDAARSLFAERGYAATTTKEIARRADASETLLFRYFGGKAALFDEVVSGPFNELMQRFLDPHEHGSGPTTRAEDSRDFVAAVYRLFCRNGAVLSALLAAPDQLAEGPSGGAEGLEDYFAKAVERLNQHYRAEGGQVDVAPDLAVRIGFGMIAAPVLLRHWLFPRGLPPASAMADALDRMLFKALSPVAAD